MEPVSSSFPVSRKEQEKEDRQEERTWSKSEGGIVPKDLLAIKALLLEVQEGSELKECGKVTYISCG